MPVSLIDLPTEVQLLLLSHLDVRSFLNFISTKKSLYNEYSDEPTFWLDQIQSTFRVPALPVVKNDGARWRKMYKRLSNESFAYGWGSNGRNCLDLQIAPQSAWRPPTGTYQGPRLYGPVKVHHPYRMKSANNIGVLSDMQCGGWSTSFLTSTGLLYLAGTIDGQYSFSENSLTVKPLLPTSRHDPSVAVKQYSQGRAHILALSDMGNIWTWRNEQYDGIRVKFLNHDISDRQRAGTGWVKKVVAGWNTSAALVSSAGILTWRPEGRDEESGIEDAILILQNGVVPDTGASSTLGKVLNFIVLESMIVFVTDHGKVFVSELPSPVNPTTPVEITVGDGTDAVVDVQGSFRTFAIFTKSGAVLTTTQAWIWNWIHINSDEPAFASIPALQNREVIALAFGDWHFHALHAPGYITSYGKELDQCGALGLGDQNMYLAMTFRGCHAPGNTYELGLQSYTSGRRIWFEESKYDWLDWAINSLPSSPAHPRGENFRALHSDWVEQGTLDWENRFHMPPSEDGLPAYFAWSVCAGGWHSGALVLVNQEREEMLKKAVKVPTTSPNIVKYRWDKDDPPRLVLDNGTETPGDGPLSKWKYGRPEHDMERLQFWERVSKAEEQRN